jgi:ADP-dependent NAD(P)H-hydrate dehydratase / NAD(P)H-hydrate epimerase
MSWITDRVGTAAMMREMDRQAIEDNQVPGLVLMENAGRGAFDFLMDEFEPHRVTVFAGKGNNGGDGYVIARHLLNHGVAVEVMLLAAKEDIQGDARTNLEALLKMGGHVHAVRGMVGLDDNRYEIARSDVLVDAILGTGLQSEVKGFYRQAIEFINGLAATNPELRVFAVDLPSGLNADTGQIMGAAVAADATATFGMIKTGQLSYPGARLCGNLALVDISLPRALYEGVPYRLLNRARAAALLPERAEDAHKGSVGHGLVLAGSPGKTGAAVMAAESALRGGAGLVTLGGPAGLHAVLEAKTLEVMTEALPDTSEHQLGTAAVTRARELMTGMTAVALGPGIGRGPEVTAFVREVIASCSAPLVIDADGLNAAAEDVSVFKQKAGPVIVTPHPGEMARLTGTSTAAVLADRLNVALGFAREHGVVVVLKGAFTIVAGPDGRAGYNPTGNPGLATGGAGDVLSGVILGLLCQGLAPFDAATLGVYLHGLAADLAAEDGSEEGLIAGDVMEFLPEAFKELRGAGDEVDGADEVDG